MASLHPLIRVADQNFPGNEDEERRRPIKVAIRSAIVASEDGLDRDKRVLSPDRLEYWLEERIKDIHKSFGYPVEEEQVPVLHQKPSPTRSERGRRQKNKMSLRPSSISLTRRFRPSTIPSSRLGVSLAAARPIHNSPPWAAPKTSRTLASLAYSTLCRNPSLLSLELLDSTVSTSKNTSKLS